MEPPLNAQIILITTWSARFGQVFAERPRLFRHPMALTHHDGL